MQHEPPTTDRDTLSVGQVDAVSDQVEHPAGGQPSGYQSSPQSDYQSNQQPGAMHGPDTNPIPNQTTDQQPGLQGHGGSHQPGNLNQGIAAGSDFADTDYADTGYADTGYANTGYANSGYLPDAITDQTSNMPDLSMLALEGKKEGSLSDYTMQELHLRSQPFIGSSAEGELFADEVTFSQISEIKQAIIKGDTVLLLTGEEGAGKTTLLKQLTRNSGARLQFFSVKGGEKYTTHNLFSGILNAWRLTPPSDFEQSAKEMLLALQANHERNTTVVLLLDDADLIPTKELHLLLATVQYFNNSEEPLLRVILSATPEFETRLPQLLPQGLKLPYSAMQVEPLLASRAAPYIQLRLNQAGHFDEFPLSEKQVSTIANDASGYPGRINFLTAETLNQIFSPFADEETTTHTSGGFFSKLANGKSRKAGKAVLGLLGIGLIAAGIYKTVIQGQKNDTDARVADAAATGSAANSTANQNNNNFTTVETRPVTNNSSTERTLPQQGNPVSSENRAASSGSEAVPLQALTSTTASTQTDSTDSGDNQQTGAEASNAADASAAAELKAAAEELSAALGTTSTSSTTTAIATPDTTTAANNSEAAANSAGSEDIAEAEQTASRNSAETQSSTDISNSTAAASASADDNTSNSTANNDSDAEVPLEPGVSTQANDGAASNSTDPEAPVDAVAAPPTTDSVTDATKPDEAPASESGTEVASPAESAASEAQQAEATEQAASGSAISSLESPNWVLLQNPDLWTIQMSASTDKSDIDRFLRNAGLEGPTSIYSFKRGDVTWYALVQGLYSGLGEAREAIEGMGKAAVKNQPWIRKIGSIQESVKK